MNAHDVRHLSVCCHCEHLGDDRAMICTGLLYFHGRCYIAGFGIKGLLALNREETGKLTLDDIGSEAMQALLDRSAA